MDNVVTITNTKENTLDFQVTIQGCDKGDTKCDFVIETGEMDLGFKCVKHENEKDKWTVVIPPLPQVKQSAHNFHITIVVDGYHFEPMRGIVNVVGSLDIHATTPKNVELTSTVPSNRQDDEPPKEVIPVKIEHPAKRPGEERIEDIAKKLIAKRDAADPVREKTNTDKAAAKILSEHAASKNKPTKPQPKKVDKKVETKPVVESIDKAKKSDKDIAALAAIRDVRDSKNKAPEKVAPTKKVAAKKVAGKKPTLKETVQVKPSKPVEKSKQDRAVVAVLESIGARPDKKLAKKTGMKFKKK